MAKLESQPRLTQDEHNNNTTTNMKLRIVHQYNMLKAVKRFILENTITPPNLRVTALATEINTAITSLEAAATAQVGGSGEASGAVTTKREKSQQLRAYLKDVARVARTLDPETHPGIAAQFVLPRNSAYAALTASARAMIASATELETELIAHGLAATFLADLNALLVAFESGIDAKIDGLQSQVGGTAGLKYRASLGVKAARKLDAIIRAHFRNDPVTLEVWQHARHIEKTNAPTPIPTTGGAPEGSGTGTGAAEGGTAA